MAVILGFRAIILRTFWGLGSKWAEFPYSVVGPERGVWGLRV